jgi:hypothetical protein
MPRVRRDSRLDHNQSHWRKLTSCGRNNFSNRSSSKEGLLRFLDLRVVDLLDISGQAVSQHAWIILELFMQSRRLGFALDWLLSFVFRACISVQYIVISAVILIPNSTKKRWQYRVQVLESRKASPFKNLNSKRNDRQRRYIEVTLFLRSMKVDDLDTLEIERGFCSFNYS